MRSCLTTLSTRTLSHGPDFGEIFVPSEMVALSPSWPCCLRPPGGRPCTPTHRRQQTLSFWSSETTNVVLLVTGDNERCLFGSGRQRTLSLRTPETTMGQTPGQHNLLRHKQIDNLQLFSGEAVCQQVAISTCTGSKEHVL